MKILFLGTGAADWPNPGKSVCDGRRFCSLRLNGNILIDCGPMTLDAIDEFGVDCSKLTDIVISHPHEDHFNMPVIEAVALRRPEDLPPLRLHVNCKAVERAIPSSQHAAERLTVSGFVPGDSFQCDGASFYAMPANHHMEVPGELAAHFAVKTDAGETLFYQLDGSWLPSRTWGMLRGLHHPFDYIIWELTCGVTDDWRLFEHSNLAMLKIEAAVFRKYGVATPATVMFCSHMARTLCPQHTFFAQQLAAQGYILAKDGMNYDSTL